MMLLRARTLAMGCSGARPVVAEAMLALLNAGLDAGRPRARLARRQRRPRPARALRAGADRRGRGARRRRRGASRRPRRSPSAGIEPLVLGAKEGLALINGTDGMLGMLVLALARPRAAAARRRHHRRDVGRGAARHRPRLRRGPASRCARSPARRASAANLRRLLAGSPIVASHRDDDPRVQDAYSLRCAPQVHGAARDTVAHADGVAERRARVGDRQPDGAARRPRRVVRQLPRRAARRSPATSSPSPSPRSARSPSAAPTACSTPPARTACRRSWPPTPASTRG